MVPLLRTKLSTGTSSPTKLAHGFLWNWPRRVHFLTLNAGCAPWLERFEILAHLILRSCCVSMSTCHAQRRKGKPCPAPQGQAALKEPLCKLQDVSHTAHPTWWKRSAGEKKWQHKSKFTGGKKSGPAFVIPVIAFMRLVVGGNRNMAYTSERVVTFARWSVATSRLDGCKIWAHCSCSPCPCIKTHFG